MPSDWDGSREPQRSLSRGRTVSKLCFRTMAAHGCGLSLRAGDSTAAEGGKEEAKTRVGEGQGLGDCLPQDRGAWRTG